MGVVHNLRQLAPFLAAASAPAGEYLDTPIFPITDAAPKLAEIWKAREVAEQEARRRAAEELQAEQLRLIRNYDLLQVAYTPTLMRLTFKDQQQIVGFVIFHPESISGAVVDPPNEIHRDFTLRDIAQVELYPFGQEPRR